MRLAFALRARRRCFLAKASASAATAGPRLRQEHEPRFDFFERLLRLRRRLRKSNRADEDDDPGHERVKRARDGDRQAG